MTPLMAAQALDSYFLEVRSKLLDLAAALDRFNRGKGAEGIEQDPRMEKIHQALDVLQGQSSGRAERVQRIFSLEYDPTWKPPQPR
jgi:hypothetical protein